MSKNAVITGVSTGIGQHLATSLLDRGYRVFGSARQSGDFEQYTSNPAWNFVPLLFDVTDHVAVDAAAQEVADQVGNEGIQFLINNAGIAVGGPILHIPIAEIDLQFQVNVIGLIKVTQAFAGLLGAHENHAVKPGRIIMISSVSGKLGMPFVGPYSGSKFAVEGISQSLRRELLLYGIDVIVVGPGAIRTPIWDKSAKDTATKYEATPYFKALERFERKFIRNAVAHALEPVELATKIVRIMEDPKPRTRYGIMAQKIKNYLLPSLLPERMVDRAIGKALGLIRKSQNEK